jgi:hypothetical protein
MTPSHAHDALRERRALHARGARDLRTRARIQRETLGAVRPGAHWDARQLRAHRVLVRGLQRLGIFKRPDAAGSGMLAASLTVTAGHAG